MPSFIRHHSGAVRRHSGVFFAFALVALLAACGGNNIGNSTVTAIPKHRVFIGNQVSSSGLATGLVQTVDGDKDQFAGAGIGTGGTPAAMLLTPDKSGTLVLDQKAAFIYVLSNAQNAVAGTVGLAGVPTSAVVLPDNKTGYAAQRTTGTVSVFDLATTFTVSNNISVPTVRTLSLSNSGKFLLAFSDDVDTLTLIDTTTNTASTIGGFDRPVYGVFSSDESKAYILSCGFECGGTQASVTVLNLATKTLGASITVPGATFAVFDPSGSFIFVAGSCANRTGVCAQFGGALTEINPVGFSVIASAGISNGYHDHIVFGSNNKIFIGSHTCDNVSFGCLSIYDSSTGAVKVDTPNGDVTGLLPIKGRNIVYVIEGGELRIFDTTTSAPAATQLDILGKAWDLVSPDQ